MTESPPSRFANLRDSFAAIREFIIVAAMLAVLFAPTRVKGVLEEAGIRSLAGVEFDATTLAESEASVAEAHAHINQLQEQLAMAQQELTKVANAGGRTPNPGLGAISELLASAQRATIETETNLNRSQEKTRNFLQRHGHGHELSPPDTERSRRPPQAQQATTELVDPRELFQR